jgi:hypothetical protein
MEAFFYFVALGLRLSRAERSISDCFGRHGRRTRLESMMLNKVVVKTPRQAWRLHLLFGSAWKEVTGCSPKEKAPVFVEDTVEVVMVPGPACYSESISLTSWCT